MSKKKRSAGAVLVSFFSGLITLILILVLVVSVTLNIAFYTKDRPFEVNIDLPFYKNHSIYFINNSGDLQEIEKGALVTIDPEIPASKSFYVLCTIGNDYKTILAVTDIEANDNGTVSYIVRGTKPSSTVTHTVPQYKIQGVVKNKNQQLGDLIAFVTDIKGAIALIAIPSFLLIILSISAIKRNKNRYEDDLVESEILIEELRKLKKGEEKKKKEELPAPAEKLPEPSAAAEIPAPVPEQSADPVTETKPDIFEEEMNRKAMAIKNAMSRQIENSKPAPDLKPEIPAPAPTPAPSSVPEKKSEEPAEAPKPESRIPEFQNYESIKEQFMLKKDSDETHNELNVQMEQLAAKQQQMAMMHDSQPAKAPVHDPVLSKLSSPASESKPAAPGQIPAENMQLEEPKKKKKRAVASIKADSFDDLIKMLDNEKKKLD